MVPGTGVGSKIEVPGGTGLGSEIWVPGGTGYQTRFRNLGTRGYRVPGTVRKLGYRVPGMVPKFGYQGVPGTRHVAKIGVPGGTGYRARFRKWGTRWYRVPGTVPKMGYQVVPGIGFLVPYADPWTYINFWPKNAKPSLEKLFKGPKIILKLVVKQLFFFII